MTAGPTHQAVRIAELVATLSYAADLGLGQPMEHSMRQAVIALRLGGLVGAATADLEATYYLGLMMNAYCHVDAAEQASWFGDDIGVKAEMFELLGHDTPLVAAYMLRRVGSHGPPLERLKRLATLPLAARREPLVSLATHAAVGAQMAGRMVWTRTCRPRWVRPTSSGTARACPGTCVARSSALPSGWCRSRPRRR